VHRTSLFALLLFLTVLGKGWGDGFPTVGVAGPAQVMTIPAGENTTSYVRLYNDGNTTGTYGLEIQGNASSIAFLACERISISPGENQRVEITYAAPVEEAFYEGMLVISLEGEQIVPGVTREIAVSVEKPAGNRPPRLSLVFPGSNASLSGDVDVVASVEDPDGDPISIKIFIDGQKVSDGATYVWRTRRWEDGEHELKISASDGTETSEIKAHFVISNPRGVPIAYVGAAAGACAGMVLLAVWYRRRST
jgi:hypothetical protein